MTTERTYDSVSFLKILRRTSAQFPRVFLDIEVCACENVLHRVNSLPQPSISENGRGFLSQVGGHGSQSEDVNVGNTNKSRSTAVLYGRGEVATLPPARIWNYSSSLSTLLQSLPDIGQGKLK